MKITLILISLSIMVGFWWARSTYRFNQSEASLLDTVLIKLSGQILYRVKTDEPVDTMLATLATYRVDDIGQGLINDNARKVFWINMYNAHYQLLARRDKKTKDIFTAKVVRFADALFSLDDIEHGILRKYRWKYSLGYLPQLFPSKPIKKLAVDNLDFRIHFALNCGAKSCPPIAFYDYEAIDEQLDLATHSFLENETIVDSVAHVLHVTKIMQWFKGDFGGEKGIRKIISKYLGHDYSTYSVKYNDYDWSEDLNNFVPIETKGK